MTKRWRYDNKYFQRMIKRDTRTNPDMNIALGIKEGNPQMIVLGVQQGIYFNNLEMIALANVQGNHDNAAVKSVFLILFQGLF